MQHEQYSSSDFENKDGFTHNLESPQQIFVVVTWSFTVHKKSRLFFTKCNISHFSKRFFLSLHEPLWERRYVIKKLAMLDAISTTLQHGVISKQINLISGHPRNKLFMNKIKKGGSIIVPWGIPQSAVVYADLKLPTLTLRKFLVRKLKMHAFSTLGGLNNDFLWVGESEGLSGSIYLVQVLKISASNNV